MKDLYFDEERHEYFYCGEKKSCVSDILKPIDAIALDGIPPQNLAKAGERGTRIHEETEAYDHGLLEMDDEWVYNNQDILPYIEAYIQFCEDYSSLPIESECRTYCEETGVAGTIDLVKEINGRLAIIDKKSTSTIGTLRNAIQLNIYRLNWNKTHERKVESLYILDLAHKDKKSGKLYRLIPFDVDENLAFKWIGIYNEIKGDKKI